MWYMGFDQFGVWMVKGLRAKSLGFKVSVYFVPNVHAPLLSPQPDKIMRTEKTRFQCIG
jgi:hypothetical protein